MRGLALIQQTPTSTQHQIRDMTLSETLRKTLQEIALTSTHMYTDSSSNSTH